MLSVACIYVISVLTTWYWIPNLWAFSWGRLIFLLLAIFGCLQTFVQGSGSRGFSVPLQHAYLLALSLFRFDLGPNIVEVSQLNFPISSRRHSFTASLALTIFLYPLLQQSLNLNCRSPIIHVLSTRSGQFTIRSSLYFDQLSSSETESHCVATASCTTPTPSTKIKTLWWDSSCAEMHD